ncbi:biliverdin-producing heme oxygenase [Aliihoeflea sp. PC F10.4]
MDRLNIAIGQIGGSTFKHRLFPRLLQDEKTGASANSISACSTVFGKSLDFASTRLRHKTSAVACRDRFRVTAFEGKQFTMVFATLEMPARKSRAQRLKQATHSTHERLDHAVMSLEPFASRERYRRFLYIQYFFHRDIEALYADTSLSALLPSIAGSSRLCLIERDLADLGAENPEAEIAPAFRAHADIDLPIALGWLYVAEGSNLGAAFLLKEAKLLGLSDVFGARHLAAAPEGRGLHWRTFKNELDAVDLTARQEDSVVEGAIAAFARVRAALDATGPDLARTA